jgi:predicted pyridoxine 5'-phosphate oxidase superfamily flavin-nucleotide-binding protein
MERPISDIAFTPAVKAAQERLGSRRAYAKMEEMGKQGAWYDIVTPDLAEFVEERDSLYLGTASADGQPYIQHRGGRKGFLKVLDEHTLALADYAGNSQYISLGNLAENNQAFMFLMDYPNRHRIKIWGTAEFIEDDPELLAKVTDADYDARPERVLVFHVKAWGPNCNLHIRQRFTAEDIESMVQPLRDRIAELEEMNATMRNRLDDSLKNVEVSLPADE